MNDRYLFRAKSIDTGEWVQGCYIYDVERGCSESLNKFAHRMQPLYAQAYAEPIDPSTLCQCTGLKDKNGKLIWENDICDRKEAYPEIVKYCKGDWTLDYSYAIHKESGGCYCNLGFYVEERKCVEVIGNVFDNPGLLESEKKQ